MFCRLEDAVRFAGQNLKLADTSVFLLPLGMYIFGGQSLLHTLGMWNFIIIVGSLHFGFVGLHAAHHHPDIFHDGDTPRYVLRVSFEIPQCYHKIG